MQNFNPLQKQIIVISFFFLLFYSCKQPSKGIDKKIFIGDWSFSEHFSYDELKLLPDFKDGLNGLKDAEMTLVGKVEYHTNAQYNLNGEMAFRITDAESGREITMKFRIREAGKWAITDSTLTETTEDGEVVPADEFTQNLAAEDPAMLKEIRPVKGETVSEKILVATTSLIEMQDRATRVKMTLRKNK
ncbi:MAG: hypothetical protein JNM68_08635 [Dinghuibacter sp.]|nr:hypothetical protein [Dinghuibacter sp.]